MGCGQGLSLQCVVTCQKVGPKPFSHCISPGVLGSEIRRETRMRQVCVWVSHLNYNSPLKLFLVAVFTKSLLCCPVCPISLTWASVPAVCQSSLTTSRWLLPHLSLHAGRPPSPRPWVMGQCSLFCLVPKSALSPIPRFLGLTILFQFSFFKGEVCVCVPCLGS